MKTKLLAASLCAAFGLGHAGMASADTQINFSGFGTVGATYSNNDGADYRGGVYQPNGPGKSSPWRYGVDTKLGLQMSANFGNGFSGVAQVVADHRGDNSYTPQFEWLNLKYDITKDIHVRAGRVVLPTFMISDTRNVGFAQTAVRPPMEVYFINPITHVDGVDIGLRQAIGEGTLTATLTLGKSKDKMNTYYVKGQSIKNLGLSYEIGSSTFHSNYMDGKVTLLPYDDNVPGTSGKFKLYMTAADALKNMPAAGYPAPNLLIDALSAQMWSLGYTYDPGTWIVQAEYAARKVEGSLVHDLEGWFVQAGYRLGKFTPYLSVSELTDKDPAMRSPALPAGGFSSIVVNAGDASMGLSKNEQKAFAAGVRYDVARNVALKAQFDVIRKHGSVATPNQGTFIGTKTAFNNSDQTTRLFTVAVDFVF